MIKPSVKIIISVVLALAVGYVLGIFINFPNLKGDNLKGDIGKASKFSQKATSDEIRAVEEQLQNDSVYLKGVLATLSLADERIELFSNLISMTTSACERVEGLRPVLAQVQGMQGMAANAQTACNEAVAAVTKISKGEEANYEQAMNDISLAYAMVSRASKTAKNVVNTFDRTIGSIHSELSNEIAFVRDEWVRFAASEAFLQSDEVALNYWGNVNPLLANDATLNMLNADAKQEFQLINAGESFFHGGYIQLLLAQTDVQIKAFMVRRIGEEAFTMANTGYSASISKVMNSDVLDFTGIVSISVANNTSNLNLFRLSGFPSPVIESAGLNFGKRIEIK